MSLKPQITAEWMFQGKLSQAYIYSNRILTFSLYNSMAAVSLHGWKESVRRQREPNVSVVHAGFFNRLLYAAWPPLIVKSYTASERGGPNVSPTGNEVFASSTPACWMRSVWWEAMSCWMATHKRGCQIRGSSSSQCGVMSLSFHNGVRVKEIWT